MDSRNMFHLHVSFFLFSLAITSSSSASAALSSRYYDRVCPEALPTIKRIVEETVKEESRMGASLLRLFFHDCFVQGCDASILLDPSDKIVDSEKFSVSNFNSVKGFEVIDRIKDEVDRVCGRPVVSCADILAVAARDSVVALGGTSWKVKLGRRDSTTASAELANENLPSPFLDLQGLILNFQKQGLNIKDLVLLSAGHTLGFSRCQNFRFRIHSENNIDPGFAAQLRQICPREGGDGNLSPFDSTPARFDTSYFSSLMRNRGLLHSDQALFGSGGFSDTLVRFYRSHPRTFRRDFGKAMNKMGKIGVLTGKRGEVRVNCRKVKD